MSAHRKKRIGSRRRVVNQNETSEADELQQTDSSTMPQHCTPEENKEPLNLLANPHGLLSETLNPPLPELSKSSRKLGSSRKSKGREHVKDFATKSYNKPTEEVEENIKGNETPETIQISLSAQPQRQEGLGQGSEYGVMSATHSSSLYSAIASNNSVEIQCSTRQNFPEDDLDGLNPKSEYPQANQDENDTDSVVASEATVLERNDRCDTLQSEELIDNAYSAGLSELPVSNVISRPTEDMQPIDQLNSKEMLEKVLTNVYSVTDNESKQSDRDAEFLQQDGNLHRNYFVSDSHKKSVEMPFPTTPKKTTDKSSPRENTELEDSIEQEVISSTNKNFYKEEKQNEPYNLSEVQSGQNLDDGIKTIQEQEVKQAEIIKSTTNQSEIDALEETGKLGTSQNKEVSGTPHSEDAENRLPEQEFKTIQEIQQSSETAHSTDGFTTKQGDVNPDDKSDVHSTTGNNVEALEQKNEDYHAEDDKETETDFNVEVSDKSVGATLEGTDKIDTFELQNNEEQKEILNSSEVPHAHYLEDYSKRDHEQQVKPEQMHDVNHSSEIVANESTENAEMISGNLIDEAEGSVTYQSELAVKGTDDFVAKQEDSIEDFYIFDSQKPELGDKEILNTAPGQVFEMEKADLKPNAEQTGLFSEIAWTNSEQILQDGNSQDNCSVGESLLKSENKESSKTPEISREKCSPEEHTEPEYSVEQAIISSPKEELPTNEEQKEILNLSEVPCAHYLEDYVKRDHEQQVKPEQMLAVKNSDDCATKPEDSNRDDNNDMHPTEGKHLEASEQANEDYHVYENEKPEISDTETVETGQEHKIKGQIDSDLKPSAELTHHQEQEGIFSESQSTLQTLNSEMNVPLDSQSPHSSVKAEEQTPTGFKPVVNRRKLGSTRRNKGRQLVKESGAESYHDNKEDDIRDGEALETDQMMVAIERTNQEESSQDSEHDTDVSVTHDSSLSPAIMPDYSSEVQSLTTSDCPKTDPDSWIQKSESCQEDDNETETDLDVEVSDKSVGASLEGTDKTNPLQGPEVRDTHQSEYAANKEFETGQEIDPSFVIVSHDSTENAEMISGSLIDETEGSVTYQSELAVKGTDDFVAKQDDSNRDDKSDVQTGLFFSEVEEKDSSFKTLQSDMQSHLDYKPQHEDTNFKPIGNRRKLGSSRRHKGRQHAKDPYTEPDHENKEEQSGNTRNNTLETEVQVQEKSIETIEVIDTFEITDMGDFNDQVMANAHVDTHVDAPVGALKLSTSSVHSSLFVDQQLIDQSDFTEMPEDELLSLNSVIEKESKNEKNDSESPRQDGNSQDNFSMSDSHLKSENKQSSHSQELFREKHSPEEHVEPDYSVVSSPTEELPTNEEQNVNAYISQLKESLHLDDGVNEMHEDMVEATQMQEMHQVHFSSVMEDESSVQTLQESEERTHTGVSPVRNRRKMGSSRRHKGRQLVKDHVTDPFHKPKEEFVENTSGGDVLEQKDACHIQKTEALSCEEDSVVQEINMQPTNDAAEAVGNVTVKEISTEVKSSMGVQVFGQNEVGEKFEDPIKKDSEAQVISASQEMMHAELFLAAHNTADALAQFDLKEKSQVQLEAGLPEESGISAAVGADSQQGIQEKTLESNSENLEQSKQRRRKMGSTRQTQLNREPNESEGDFNMEAGIHFHKIEVAEAVADTKDGEQSVDINVETSKLDDFTDTGIHITSELTERNATNTDFTRGKFLSSFEATQRTQNDEERLDSVNVIQAQALKSAEASIVAVADLEIVKPVVGGGAGEEHSDTQVSIQDPNNLNEGALTESPEMKNTSPNLNSARRRKMGSTRKSLSSRSKREDFHQKQVEDSEAIGDITNVGDVESESFPGIKEKEELQLHIETKEIDPEQRQEKLIETVEYSNTGESHLKHPSNQTFEEKSVSPGNPMETEHLLNPNYFPVVPSTSPTHDVMSETAGGRRRKLGSSRKSRGLQSNENQTARKDRTTDTQNERDVRGVTDESAVKTTAEESLGLAKISEVDENDQKPSSNISTEHPRPVSEKTAARVNPVQQPRAETRPSQESQKTFSLSISAGADRSNAYNVLMVGDSSVGKTSFIKRAQSGKFSLDLPASVGIDACMWTVVVEGKPVVLKLWDTAGQERFHSITRQIFHKAQAFLLMYDITSSQSFAAVRYWLNCIQEGAAENVTIVLLGNKSDHAGRQVQSQEGENLAKDYGFEFMECSAATGENVINSLETVARMLSQKPDTREETSVLHKEPQQKKSSGCC